MQDIGSASFKSRADKTSLRKNCNKIFTRFAIFSFICLALSLTFPLICIGGESVGLLTILLSLISGAVILYTSRSFLGIVVVGLFYFAVFSFTGSTAVPALAVSTVALCGIYSALVAETSLPQTSVAVALLPITSFAASFALTGELFISLVPMAAFIPAFVSGITARRNGGRKDVISAFAAAAAIELILASAAYIHIKNGALSPEIIKSSADYLRASTAELLKTAVLRTGNVPLGDEIISEIALLSGEMINCLPGLFAILLLTAGFCVQKIQHSLFERSELEELQNKSGEQLRASSLSALVFIFSHICSFSSGASNDGSVFSYTAMNISLILLPLMLAVGVGFLASLPHKIGFLALAIWIGAIILSGLLSSSVITVLALIGSFYTLIICVDSWAKDHYSKGEDQ